jgi:phenylalanyl-tRNA synthetase beta chain
VLLTQAAPGGWRSEARPADFFATRALLDTVLGAAGLGWRAEVGAWPFLHPGRAATIVIGDGGEVGWIGELHPLVLRDWELPGPAAAFELDVDAVLASVEGEIDTYHDVTSFPAVLEDIAVVLPEDVRAAEVEEAVRRGGAELLVSQRVFDLYRGEQVGPGSKSLALRLEFRAPDRTLTDREVAERRAAIEGELAKIGGRLRA